MTNEIDLGQQAAQSFPTQEEAEEALKTYAWKYAEISGNPHDFEDFVAAHTVIEIQQTSYAIALKDSADLETFAS